MSSPHLKTSGMRNALFILSLIIFSSCSDEQIINPRLYPLSDSTAGLKSKYMYSTASDTSLLSVTDYVYNSNGQIDKISYYSNARETLFHYEMYFYNNNGLPIYKLNYWDNIYHGFRVLDSTTYSYSANLLVSEKIHYGQAGYNDEYRYEYRNNFLYKKTKYHNGEPETYTVYLYKNDKLFKEEEYFVSNGSLLGWKEYYFRGSLLTSIFEFGSNSLLKSKTEFFYDIYGKRILESVSDLPVFSSSLPYIIKYIY